MFTHSRSTGAIHNNDIESSEAELLALGYTLRHLEHIRHKPTCEAIQNALLVCHLNLIRYLTYDQIAALTVPYNGAENIFAMDHYVSQLNLMGWSGKDLAYIASFESGADNLQAVSQHYYKLLFAGFSQDDIFEIARGENGGECIKAVASYYNDMIRMNLSFEKIVHIAGHNEGHKSVNTLCELYDSLVSLGFSIDDIYQILMLQDGEAKLYAIILHKNDIISHHNKNGILSQLYGANWYEQLNQYFLNQDSKPSDYQKMRELGYSEEECTLVSPRHHFRTNATFVLKHHEFLIRHFTHKQIISIAKMYGGGKMLDKLRKSFEELIQCGLSISQIYSLSTQRFGREKMDYIVYKKDIINADNTLLDSIIHRSYKEIRENKTNTILAKRKKLSSCSSNNDICKSIKITHTDRETTPTNIEPTTEMNISSESTTPSRFGTGEMIYASTRHTLFNNNSSHIIMNLFALLEFNNLPQSITQMYTMQQISYFVNNSNYHELILMLGKCDAKLRSLGFNSESICRFLTQTNDGIRKVEYIVQHYMICGFLPLEFIHQAMTNLASAVELSQYLTEFGNSLLQKNVLAQALHISNDASEQPATNPRLK